MIRANRAFLRGLASLAWPWWIWVALLGLVNGVAPLYFLGSLEARVVLAALLAAAAIQLVLVARLGFVRLLGLGHVLAWVPMLLWLVSRLGNYDTATPFGRWLVALVALNLASLAIDFVDVGRYLAGERQPAPGTAPPGPPENGGER